MDRCVEFAATLSPVSDVRLFELLERRGGGWERPGTAGVDVGVGRHRQSRAGEI
jgi:hypothetical protein